MTREEWAERLPLIQAFVEGKTIQINFDGPWEDFDGGEEGPEFDDLPIKYRIKPEPKVIWCNEYETGSMLLFDTEQQALDCPHHMTPSQVAVKYQEVIE